MPRIHVQSEITHIRAQTAPGPERAAALRQLVQRLQQAVREEPDVQAKYRLSVLGRHVQRLADDEGRR
jgi:hypothetical protein